VKKVLAAVAGVVVLLVVVGVLFGDDDGNGSGDGDDVGAEVVALGASPALADCTPVEHEQPIPTGPPHRSGTLDWPEIPPNSGEHHPQTLRTLTRFYEREDEPAPERAVHDLEHGIVVAWYDGELPDEEVEALRRVADAMPITRFVAVPWLREPFPDDRHVVLTAWGHTQRCRRVSGQVFYDFTRTYADKDAPEKGAPV
jgi:hypothetical protein